MRRGLDRGLKRFAGWVTANTGTVLTAAGATTVVLVFPMLAMVPTETASQSPTNNVTTAQDHVSSRFASPVHEMPLVVEAVDGDILSRSSLVAIFERAAALRTDPAVAPNLATRYVPRLDVTSTGLYTIADAVDQLLTEQGSGLGLADQASIDAAVDRLLAITGPQAWGLAHQATRDPAGRWTAPAMVALVEADNQALGGGGNFVAIGAQDLTKEHYSRDVLAVLRADQDALSIWTVATDVNLTSIEQGTRAGPFIGLTVFVILIVLLIVFRSYWLTATAGLALGAMMIWLKGLANAIGLESDQILATIVPIGIISFGIDSTFHVFGRYREEGRGSQSPRLALRVGLVAVFSPVALALSSDVAAFLANGISPIESVRQFGVAAALGSLAAFFLLGVCVPLAVSEIEEARGDRPWTRWGRAGDQVAAVGALALATASVLVLVFVSPAVGTILLALYGLVAIGLPLRLAARASDRPYGSRPPRSPGPPESIGRLETGVERVAMVFALRPLPTSTVVAGVTGFVFFFAIGVRPSFDVTDFFAPDVDFVAGLDKVIHYSGGQAGEPAAILVETDLGQPETLAATTRFVDELRALDTRLLATDETGTMVSGGVVDLVRDAMHPDHRVGPLAPTWRADIDGDGLPDTAADIGDVLAGAAEHGVQNHRDQPLWTPEVVSTVVGPARGDGDGTVGLATPIGLELPETANQESIDRVRRLIEPMAKRLETELRATVPSSSVTFTGSPIFRDEQLNAVVRSLLLSLPIATGLCFLLAALFTGSFRLAIVTTIPVLLVVIWLYGFMAFAGYGINVVTATIGAISIGIGIDFATHMTMRVVEEHRHHAGSQRWLRDAIRGTGTALTGSAATSAAGFSILSLAPMPMFATYGLLTALMVVFALLAAVIVLPSLLILFGRLDEGTPNLGLGVGSRPRPSPPVPPE